MTEPSLRSDRAARVRADVRSAATMLFTEHGFAATGVREIGRKAGVDPALVMRYFGSKEALFLLTMTFPQSWADAFDGPLEGIGRRVVRRVVDGRAEGLRVYAALIRASDSPEVGERLKSMITEVFTAPVIRRLDDADAELRAHLFAAQLEGLLSAITIREDPVLLRLSGDELVDRFGALLQSTLTDA